MEGPLIINPIKSPSPYIVGIYWIYPPYKGIQQGGIHSGPGPAIPWSSNTPSPSARPFVFTKLLTRTRPLPIPCHQQGSDLFCLVKQPKIHSLNPYPQEEPVCFQKDLCFSGINLFMLSYFAWIFSGSIRWDRSYEARWKKYDSFKSSRLVRPTSYSDHHGWIHV